LAFGRELDAVGFRSAPHHFGGYYGNFGACHLAGAIKHFSYVEWDEATTAEIDTSGYTIRNGWVVVPKTPGFGLALDNTMFERAIARDGFRRNL
jgi:L-alanine-DL-glutamate epimerase-like enolase superfamily enzyme